MSRPRSTTSPVDELGAVLADLKARMTRVEQQSHLHPASGPGGLVPVGTVFAFGGSAAPTGYLLLFGQTVSRTTYADLFAVFGTTYGVGDGVTTFGLPDLRGRVIAGVDNMGGVAANRLTATTMAPNGNTRGATGGAQTGAHYHMLPVGADGANAFIVDSFATPATDVIVVNRWAGAGLAVAGARRSASDNTTIDRTQPTLLLNYIVKT